MLSSWCTKDVDRCGQIGLDIGGSAEGVVERNGRRRAEYQARIRMISRHLLHERSEAVQNDGEIQAN